MMSLLMPARIPGVLPPELLIFFHIPKTGGTTMENLIERIRPGPIFNAACGPTKSSLLVRPTQQIAGKLSGLAPERRRAVRFVIGVHLALDVATLFEQPSKFFTIVRHPVERAISSFFHLRTEAHLPSYNFTRNMTLEEYLDGRLGLDAHNQQVRMLSGCPDLDLPWSEDGRPIPLPPVERAHLEKAKRNIEEHFLIAGQLQNFAAIVWYLKRLYGWPLARCFYRDRNVNETRPIVKDVSPSTLARLAEWNQFDLELYEWVGKRFASQVAPLQPQFNLQVSQFTTANRLALRAAEWIPRNFSGS
jgi:hypothetical protein